LRQGWVIVGSLPTTDGTAATAKAGCLLVLDSAGQVVETFSGTVSGAQINGPWDMTALDLGSVAELFVSNVLTGTVAANGKIVKRGSVVRLILFLPPGGMPQELLRTVVGSGFEQRTDPAALVIGPTGLGLGADGTLYVANTLGNRITAISNAVTRLGTSGPGKTISSGAALNGPLGLAIAPNGDILTANAGDGNLVETTPAGSQVAVKAIDTSGAGAGTLFGLAITPNGKGVYFVDDGDNTFDLLH
jgi:DNA-binding beta-propeller fold protein YncE